MLPGSQGCQGLRITAPSPNRMFCSFYHNSSFFSPFLVKAGTSLVDWAMMGVVHILRGILEHLSGERWTGQPVEPGRLITGK